MTKRHIRTKLHIDQEQVQLKRDAERIIRSGTLEEFKEMLRLAGKNPESPEGKELIDRLIALGASGRFPQ